MTCRTITLIGAPSSIGIRPYDSGRPRRLDEAPGVLRKLGLAARLGAEDRGDVLPAEYRDFVRQPGQVRNEAEVIEYSRAIADKVEAALRDRRYPIILGGDCSIVLGCTWGAQRAMRGPIGLAYIDGHADFATPQESATGSAASLCLGLVVGRGDTPLSRLSGSGPLVEGDNVALIGRRDFEEAARYGHDALRQSEVLDLPDPWSRAGGYSAAVAQAVERLGREELAGFWVHLDVDVLDPVVMQAVDSPLPGGPGIESLEALLAPLVRHPKALGMEVTIYDPALDPDRACGARLVSLIGNLLSH